MTKAMGTIASLMIWVGLVMMGYGIDTMPECATEDSINCVWHGDTRGNGEGRSFVNIDDTIIYIEVK